MSTFKISRTIRLGDTDAAGITYTPAYFRMAHEAYEAFLDHHGLPLKKFIDGKHPPTPVVHAEADFNRPLRLGDTIELRVRIVCAGTSSFTTEIRFTAEEQPAATVTLIHTALDPQTLKPCPVPERIANLVQPE